MSSNDEFSLELADAGQRVAARSGVIPPPLDSIRVEVARRQRSQRFLTGAVTAVALLAIVPVVAFFFARGGEDPSLVTAASDAAVEQAAATTSPVSVAASETPVPDSLATQAGDFDVDLEENVSVQIQIGDRDYSLEVIVDEEAQGRAAQAEAAAEETRIIDDTTIWLRDLDGQTEASALVDGDTFAVATGPSDEVIDALDDLSDFAENAAPFLNGEIDIDSLLGEGFADSFGEDFDPETFLGPDFDFEGWFGPNFDPEAFLGDDFDIEDLFGEDFDPEAFLGDDFDPESFFEDGEFPFDLEGLGENGFDLSDLDDLSEQFDELAECFGPALEQAQETGSFVLPECDLAS